MTDGIFMSRDVNWPIKAVIYFGDACYNEAPNVIVESLIKFGHRYMSKLLVSKIDLSEFYYYYLLLLSLLLLLLFYFYYSIAKKRTIFRQSTVISTQ